MTMIMTTTATTRSTSIIASGRTRKLASAKTEHYVPTSLA
jgi:hypothetical protein